MSEARQNPLSALPAAGAAGVAGLALFAAASALLSPSVVPEGGEYKGLGIGQDGIVRVGLPAGGEVLVPGAPFQPENGYLGMWCVSRVESVIERSHAYVRAGTGRRRAPGPCPRTRRRRRRRR